MVQLYAELAAVADPRTVTIAEAVELTGLSKKAIQNRIDKGNLPATVIEGRRRIPLAELERRGLLQRMPAEPPPKGERIAELADRLERMGDELGELAAELRVELRELRDD